MPVLAHDPAGRMGESEGFAEQGRGREQLGGGLHLDSVGNAGSLLLHNVLAVHNELLMQRDAHRTDICTRPAEAGGIRQLLIIVITAKQRRNDRSNRTRIDGTVSMPADMAVDRTDIQAGTAADTLQSFVEFTPQNIGAAVIDDHQMEFLRSVGLPAAEGPMTVI